MSGYDLTIHAISGVHKGDVVMSTWWVSTDTCFDTLCKTLKLSVLEAVVFLEGASILSRDSDGTPGYARPVIEEEKVLFLRLMPE